MSKAGIAHPTTLDLVTQSETEVRLVLVEESALSDEAAPALQEKMNNYLDYALSGELSKQYPGAGTKKAIIRVDLWARPSVFILEFLARYREAVAQYQIQVEVSVEGKAVL